MILAGPDAGDVIQVAIFVIIILGSIFGSFVERMARKKRQEEALQRLRESRERREAEGPPPPPRAEPERRSFFEDEEEEEAPARVDPVRAWFEQRVGRRPEPPPPPPRQEDIVIREVVSQPDDDDFGDAGEDIEASTEAAFAEGGGVDHGTDTPLYRRVFKGVEHSPLAEAVVYTELLGPCRGRRLLRGDRRVSSY